MVQKQIPERNISSHKDKSRIFYQTCVLFIHSYSDFDFGTREAIAKLLPTFKIISYIFSSRFFLFSSQQSLLLGRDAYGLRLRYKIVSCGFRSGFVGACSHIRIPRRIRKKSLFVCLTKSHAMQRNSTAAIRQVFSPISWSIFVRR